MLDDVEWLRELREKNPAVFDAARAVVAENNWAPFVLRAVAAGILKGIEISKIVEVVPPKHQPRREK